jgi:hypothetical protein
MICALTKTSIAIICPSIIPYQAIFDTACWAILGGICMVHNGGTLYETR